MFAWILAVLLAVPATAPAHCRSGTGGLRILIAYSELAPGPVGLRRRLLAQPGVRRVALADAGVRTPRLGQLRRSDLVVAFGDSPLASGRALGDRLAAYALGGGVVVTPAFATYDNAAYAISGRWRSGGLSPFSYTATVEVGSRRLGPVASSHPLLRGVRRLRAPLAMRVEPAAGALPLAAWSDGLLGVAVKGRAVGVNAYLGGGLSSGSGDFARLIVNAGRWLAPRCGA